MREKALLTGLAVLALGSACTAEPARNEDSNITGKPAALSLTRLDCGAIRVKNFDSFFSDRPGLYAAEARDVTDSCYLIRHGDELLLWDTGVDAALKGGSFDTGAMVLSLKTTLAEQLDQLGLKPADVAIVGISHGHGDHLGQAAQFPAARLIIGDQDFEFAQKPGRPGGPNPIAPWTGDAAKVTRVTADLDIFGDGSVVALRTAGHTPDHLALLVNLASGPVLLSGDLYHSTEAREKRGVPPFNTSREQTLQSMDAFEAKAEELGAKVIIQHEPADIAKLPAFPKAAE
ncbi:MAG: N-acyl homoserine lactonase family protein [Sphingomicrobium sp.]